MLFYILFNKCLLKEPAKRDHKSLEKMKLILKYLENHYMERITIADISAEVGLSQSHFMKYFKNTMGTSFIEYLNEYRLTMASRLLISSESSILAIAEEVGYENLSYFNRTFKKRFGMTPRDYRKRLNIPSGQFFFFSCFLFLFSYDSISKSMLPIPQSRSIVPTAPAFVTL